MVRDSLTVDPSTGFTTGTIVANGSKGYWIDIEMSNYYLEELKRLEFEVLIGPKTMVLWSE